MGGGVWVELIFSVVLGRMADVRSVDVDGVFLDDAHASDLGTVIRGVG